MYRKNGLFKDPFHAFTNYSGIFAKKRHFWSVHKMVSILAMENHVRCIVYRLYLVLDVAVRNLNILNMLDENQKKSMLTFYLTFPS